MSSNVATVERLYRDTDKNVTEKAPAHRTAFHEAWGFGLTQEMVEQAEPYARRLVIENLGNSMFASDGHEPLEALVLELAAIHPEVVECEGEPELLRLAAAFTIGFATRGLFRPDALRKDGAR